MNKAELIEYLGNRLGPDVDYSVPENNWGASFTVKMTKPEPPKTRGQVIAEELIADAESKADEWFYLCDSHRGTLNERNVIWLRPHYSTGLDNTKQHARKFIAGAIDAACAEAVKEEREACAKALEEDHYITLPGLIRARSLPTDAGKGE